MIDYSLKYSLNKHQLLASTKILDAYQNNQNVVLEAVCGAGKTQMLYEVINYALNNNQKVGISVCRKQLLYELYDRIKDDFKIKDISLHTGEIKQITNKSFIFLTCHQLVKYPHYFDLLIIDEVDAFPFCDNYELEYQSIMSSKRFIFLSATLPNKYNRLVDNNHAIKISVNNRFHYQKIPQPKVIIKNKLLCDMWLIKYLKKCDSQVIIFVSDIKKGYKLESKLRLFKIKTNFVSSKCISQEILNSFRNKEFEVLISTTILERGVTFKKINVVVYLADNDIFNSQTLIQISGRVGRDYKYYDGDIYFLCQSSNLEIEECLRIIGESNEMSGL